MALFGIGKKKKNEPTQPMPPPPSPPASMKSEPEKESLKLQFSGIGSRHKDDLDAAPKTETRKNEEGPEFPEIPKLDLPEIEAPEEKELPPSIPSHPEPQKKEDEMPDSIPELPKKEVNVPDENPKIPKFHLPGTKQEASETVAKEERAKASPHKIEEIPENLPELEEIELPKEVPKNIPDIEEVHYKPKKKAPLFINVNSYSDMINDLNATRAKLTEYVSAAGRILEVKSNKDEAMEKWRNTLEDIERKLIAIDNTLFEGG